MNNIVSLSYSLPSLLLALIIVIASSYAILTIISRSAKAPDPGVKVAWAFGGGYVLMSGVWTGFYLLLLSRQYPVPIDFSVFKVVIAFVPLLFSSLFYIASIASEQLKKTTLFASLCMSLSILFMVVMLANSLLSIIEISILPLPMAFSGVLGFAIFYLGAIGLNNTLSLYQESRSKRFEYALVASLLMVFLLLVLDQSLVYKVGILKTKLVMTEQVPKSFIIGAVGVSFSLTVMVVFLACFVDWRLAAIEEDLQQSEAFSSLLLSSVGEGIYGINNEGVITFVNSKVSEFAGAEEGALIGLKERALFNCESDALLATDSLSTLIHTLSHQGVFPGEKVVVNRQGKELVIVETRTPLVKQDKTVGEVVSIRDVTARVEQRYEAQIRAEEDRTLGNMMRTALQNDDMQTFLESCLKSLMDSVSWLALMPKSGVFVKRNTPSGPVLDLTVSYNLGGNVEEMCQIVEFGRCLCGLAAQTKTIQFANCVDDRHHNRFLGMQGHGHYNVPIKDGDEVLGVIVLYLPEGYKTTGQELAFLMRVADVFGLGMKQRYAEKSLLSMQKSTEHMATLNSELIEAIAAAVIAVGADDRITHWNSAAEELFAVKAEETIGKEVLHSGISLDWLSISPAVLQLKIGQIDHFKEEYELDIDGHFKIVSVTITPFNVSSAEHGYLLLVDDVTEERELQHQLRQAEKMQSIGQLAAGIAHEINTPIQYVGDNVRFLQDAYSDLLELVSEAFTICERAENSDFDKTELQRIADKAEEIELSFLKEEVPGALKQSQEGVERVAQIVRAMKDFSHPGSDEKELSDLNRAVESTVTVTRNVWKYVSTVELELDPQLPLVPVLLGPLNEVILNMIVNAAHAIGDVVEGSGERGVIRIKTKLLDDWVSITITDTGAGMDKAVMKRIFDPFFTTKEVGRGTGQGLSLSHKIIHDQHGGKISVDSEVGEGTRFTIMLPLEPSDSAGIKH